jgi:hypothetical protein
MYHLKLALGIATIGFIFTSRPWLRTLHGLSPEVGLVAKLIAMLSSILILYWFDPSIKIIHHGQALGVLMVYTAFMMIFNYQSDWIEDSGSDNVGDQTVDGAVYNRSRTILNLNPELARLMTFVVVPFLFAYLGSKFVRSGQKINI